jgi:hypothetical protein
VVGTLTGKAGQTRAGTSSRARNEQASFIAEVGLQT